MCKKLKGVHNRIDKCMKHIIDILEEYGIKTLACCCGHSKYKMTIVISYPIKGKKLVKNKFVETKTPLNFELISGEYLPRKRKFYKKDKGGFYYIPECIK